jgi:hypothetical protein
VRALRQAEEVVPEGRERGEGPVARRGMLGLLQGGEAMSETNLKKNEQMGHKWENLYYSDGDGRVGVLCTRCGIVFFIEVWLDGCEG